MTDVDQTTGLPATHAEVIEARQYQVECPYCEQEQVGQPPASLEMEQTFGGRLEAPVVYYCQEQHRSYVRTQDALRNLRAVEISRGEIDNILRRAGQRAIQKLAAIERALQESAVIHCAETSARMDDTIPLCLLLPVTGLWAKIYRVKPSGRAA